MNKLKPFFLLVLVELVTFVIACSGDKNDSVVPDIMVAQSEMSFSKSGAVASLSVKSNVSLKVSSDQSWCTVESASSSSTSVYKYNVIVAENATSDERVATLLVTGGDVTKTVKITQSAADGLIVKQTTYDVDAGGGTVTVNLQVNGEYSVAVADAWIKQVVSRSMTDKTESFTVASNSGEARTGTIAFARGTHTEKVTINQKAFVTTDADKSGMESEAKELASKIKVGWNLGNTMEVPGTETGWGNPKATKALIDAVKQAGFNAVRIPCAWNSYIVDGAYNIKTAWLSRVKEVVDYCTDNGMYVILNIHWDSGWLEENCTKSKQEEVNKKQKALWTQIAGQFKNYDEHLLFAGCNEPNADNAEQMSVLRTYEQTFVDAVRATGGRNFYRNLIIQGPKTDIEKTEKLFGNMPTDVVKNRLMAEVHYYTPWQFCGLKADESWGRMFYFWGKNYHLNGSDRNATWGEEEEMKVLFQKMKTMFVDKDIPVILGEYGAIKRSNLSGEDQEAHLKSRAYFNKCATELAKKYGLVPFYWDNGGDDFGLFNRQDNTVGDKKLLESIMEGAANGNYPY